MFATVELGENDVTPHGLPNVAFPQYIRKHLWLDVVITQISIMFYAI